MNIMAKTKKKQEHYLDRGPASPDDPIYTSGYIMLRPIRGRKPDLPSDETKVNAESSDPTDTDQEISESAGRISKMSGVGFLRIQIDIESGFGFEFHVPTIRVRGSGF